MSVAQAGDPPAEPFRLAGLPLAHWAYSCRIWAAMMVALWFAFWLQLDSASSSAVTVAILAQPRSGEAFRKAAFRFGATIVGVVASIVITAIFTQSRDLYVIAIAAWMASAVYIASLYDGTRAYGAVLSGYTVAIVAVSQIDNPQNVFTNATARLAVVSLGIASIALINDVFAAPTVYPSVQQRLRQAQQRTMAIVARLVRGEPWQPDEVVALLTQLTGTRLDILAVSSEGASGSYRSGAAGSAAVALINALSKARALCALAQQAPDAGFALLSEALDRDDPSIVDDALEAEMTGAGRSRERVTCLLLASNLLRALRLAADELHRMEAGRRPLRRVSMPIHRDREVARRASARVFLAVSISGFMLTLSSWPMTSGSWTLICVLAGLSATVPSARAMAKAAMIVFPVGFIVAGITEYIILDGADSFPLLMIGMGPEIFVSCLLFLNPKTGTIGFLLLVFSLVFFAPSNPQNYSAQTYVLTGILDIAGAFIFAMFTLAFFPVSDKDRRRWMVNRARQNLLEAMAGHTRYAPDEMAYLTADRIVALSKFQIGLDSAKRWRMTYTLLLSNLTLVVGRGQDSLDEVARAGAPRKMVDDARDAFSRLDPAALHASAEALLRAAPAVGWGSLRDAAQSVADLEMAGRLVEDNASTLRHLRHVFTQ